MKSIRHVVIYVRKSREEETPEALQRQQSVLIDLCEQNGWEWEMFFEVGSSQEFNRKELQKMLDKVKLFMYDAVVVADQDRLSRHVGHFAQIKTILLNAGCLLVTPTQVFDFSKDSDDMVSDFMSVISKGEYKQSSKRLVRGTKRSARDGNWVGKKNPLGYMYNKTTKRLEVTEDAPVVRRLFEEYARGLSTKDIAFNFNNEGVTTSTGFLWSPASVARLLGNIVYRGHSLYGRTRQRKNEQGKRIVEKTDQEDQILVKDTHEPIVSQELWDEVQRQKDKRNSRPIPLKLGKHTFSGLIHCGICGGVLSFQKSRGRQRITSCQTRHYSEDMKNYTLCPNSGAYLEDFEKLFYAELSQYVEEVDKYADLVRETVNQADPRENDIESKQKQIKKLEQSVKRVQSGFKAGIFNEEEAGSEIKQLRESISFLEKQIAESQTKEEEVNEVELAVERLKDFMRGSSSMTEREKNEILSDFVETILFTKTGRQQEVEIHWREF